MGKKHQQHILEIASMTFYTSMTAKIKYLVRTTICKLGYALHLLNCNPDNRDRCTKSLNGSNNSVIP